MATRQIKDALALVTTTINGIMAAADKVKLNGIATGATANRADADTDVAINTAVVTHVQDPNPHAVYQLLAEKGQPSGYAPLNASGTIDSGYLPPAAIGGMDYQGTWDAATNTPSLVTSTGTKNHYYIVSVAGTTNLDGITDWQPGDWAVYDGTTWEKIDNTDQGITQAYADANYDPLNSTKTAAQISDATATGRSILQAATAAAVRTILGLGSAALSAATDFATADHGHAQLHDAVTVADTATLDFGLTGQQLSGTVLDSPKVGGVSISGTPAAGYVPIATSGTAATWQTLAIPRQIAGWTWPGTPANSAEGLAIYTLDVAMTVTDVVGYSKTAATADAPITIAYKRGAGAWTALHTTLPKFASGAQTVTAGSPATIDLDAGDLLRMTWGAAVATSGVSDITVQVNGRTR